MKTLITFVLLALSFTVSAQTVTGMQRNSDGTITTTYSDGSQITHRADQRPLDPNVVRQAEALEAEAARIAAYRNSEEYLKRQCKIEGDRVFYASLNYGRYWHLMTDARPYEVCKKYRQAKKARKAKERAERRANR